MKATSFVTLGSVLIAFSVIQGWVVTRAFIAPRVFVAVAAAIEGHMADVRTPIQGTVTAVMAQDNQRVQEDQELFTISRIVTDPATLEWRHDDLHVYAVQSGIVTNVQAKLGLFAQADQKLATIVDNAPDAMRIRAQLPLAAGDVSRIRAGLPATVTADFLNGGRPIAAIVSSVDPVYDAYWKTLSVELKLLQFPDGIETTPLGLPVQATVMQERAPDDNMVIAFYSWFFPRSNALSD